MSSDRSAEVKFEIGHVLFIDIVSYSKLLITEQSDQLQILKQIVRGTEQFRLAKAKRKLLGLPTGDGGALVFRNTPEAPVLCALEVAKALKAHPDLKVRMGIHSGPVNEIADLNEQANIAGAGINLAQRVMDCGDAGHILLSRHVADDLEEHPRWRSHLHSLGEAEVKHRVRLGLVNFYNEEIGNPDVPRKLRARKRKHVAICAIAAALIVAAAIGFVALQKQRARSTSTIPNKSIAVLPFENLSSDKENAYFAEGDLPRAATLLAPLHPNADDTALVIQVYQSILERRPAPIIPGLKEILAKPDPAWGYNGGELRFWLGWAQEVAGDHAAAQESWRQARSELESFLKEQPGNSFLVADLAFVNMGLGDKARALALSERAMTANPAEKDAVYGSTATEVLVRVAARMGEPDRAIAGLQKLLSIPYGGALASNAPLTPAVLRLDPMFDPLRNDPRFQKLCQDKPK